MQWIKSKKILTTTLQIIVGVVFVFSGLMKGIDPLGTAIKIGEYFSSFGIHSNPSVDLIFSIVLNLFEAALGIALLIGFRPTKTKFVALALMGAMTLLTLYIYIFNPVTDCGCFGDAIIISNKATFWKNVVLLSLVIYLYFNGEHWHNWLNVKGNNYALLAGVIVFLGFNLANIKHLPIIDFRPYKVGSDLMKLTTTGGSEGEYIYNFVYQKDGVEKVFGIDELNDLDSTWIFVRDEIEVIKEAARPPGADFVLTREDGSNAMEDLAYQESEAILVISPDITAVQPKMLEEIVEKSPYPLLLAMGNTADIWSDPRYTKLEKRFAEIFFLDKTTAITIVRSNPGVLLIKAGKIVDKLSGSDFKSALNKEGIRSNSPSLDHPIYSRFDKFGFIGILSALYILITLCGGIIRRINIVKRKKEKRL